MNEEIIKYTYTVHIHLECGSQVDKSWEHLSADIDI